MAVITPQTDVYLIKVPLEINDLNQLTFANATAQYNYFNTLSKLSVDNFTYQRKDDTIRYGANFDSLLSYNYVMYRNDAFSNKWFYAFITDMEYLNDNVTAISIKTDAFQTWQFDLNYKPCLIDREHTNDDTIGAHTLPEGLELGEYVINGDVTNFGSIALDYLNEHYYTIIEVTQVENNGVNGTLTYSWVNGSHELTPKVNNLQRGTIPLIVGGMAAGSSSGQIRKPSDVTHLYDVAGLGDSVVNMFILPETLVGAFNEIKLTATPTVGSVVDLDGIFVPMSSNGVFDMGTSSFSRPTTINGYTPKNNKLKTYPFCYFNISNNSGSSNPYRYEDFSSTVEFKTEGTFGISGNVKTIPQNYLNISTNENGLDYSVNGPKYPVCSWESDSYTNWLTQNAVNLETEWTKTFINPLLSPSDITSRTAGKSVSGNLVNMALDQHAAKTQANMTSDQAKGNMNIGDFLWSKYRSPFTYLPMSIKAEYARCIDEYFSEFGYKCNRVKIPNITGRRNWNYVKTVGCYIEADIPQDDLAEIKSMFDRGITLWHNPATFADYSQTNDII